MKETCLEEVDRFEKWKNKKKWHYQHVYTTFAVQLACTCMTRKQSDFSEKPNAKLSDKRKTVSGNIQLILTATITLMSKINQHIHESFLRLMRIWWEIDRNDICAKRICVGTKPTILVQMHYLYLWKDIIYGKIRYDCEFDYLECASVYMKFKGVYTRHINWKNI